MKLNLAELRRIEKEIVVGTHRYWFRRLLNNVEVAAKYRELKQHVYRNKSTIEDFNRMQNAETKLFELLEDVEVGD